MSEERSAKVDVRHNGWRARRAIRLACVPSWALLGKRDGVLRARLHPNENYPFARALNMAAPWNGGMSEFDPFAVIPPLCACLRAAVRRALRVSNFASSAMRGKEGRWTENCFMPRF